MWLLTDIWNIVYVLEIYGCFVDFDCVFPTFCSKYCMQYTAVWVTGRKLELNEVVVDVITGAGLVSMEW